MKYLGAQQKSLEWFENYLDFRIITIKVDNEISEEIMTQNQISEGSAL